MPDPYYATPAWRALRADVLRRDGYRCAVTGCASRATHADHIKPLKPRWDGGAEAISSAFGGRTVWGSISATFPDLGGRGGLNL